MHLIVGDETEENNTYDEAGNHSFIQFSVIKVCFDRKKKQKGLAMLKPIKLLLLSEHQTWKPRISMLKFFVCRVSEWSSCLYRFSGNI